MLQYIFIITILKMKIANIIVSTEKIIAIFILNYLHVFRMQKQNHANYILFGIGIRKSLQNKKLY